MDCPKCRAANPDTSKFCGSCAAPLDAASLTITITAPPPAPDSAPLIAGKYRLEGEIGRGGMGVVHRAWDVTLRRRVALKFLPAELTHDEEARERFVREAHAASVLDHPHICTIHEIGETEDGRMFIAMALCTGESLRSMLRRGPLEPGAALSLALHVAQGLAAAHEAGIVHRDVKPGNILVSKDGTARVADFGLAKLAGEARVTRPGQAMGTAAYMAPEQLRGEDVDARADVWALGVVLYEMLAGSPPFRAESEQGCAYAIVNCEPDIEAGLPAATPPGLVRIVEKALAKDPADRPASAVEMAIALKALRYGTTRPEMSGAALATNVGAAGAEAMGAGTAGAGAEARARADDAGVIVDAGADRTRGKSGLRAFVRRHRTVAAAGAVLFGLALAAAIFLVVRPNPGRSFAILPLTAVGGGGGLGFNETGADRKAGDVREGSESVESKAEAGRESEVGGAGGGRESETGGTSGSDIRGDAGGSRGSIVEQTIKSDTIFAGGMTDFIARQLARIVDGRRGAWVFPTSEIRANEIREASDAGAVLGADIAITGTIRRSGNHVTINLEAVEPRRLRTLWRVTKSDELANIATWQEDLILEIAEASGLRTGESDRQALAAGGTTVPAAFEPYIRGLGFLAVTDTPAGADSAAFMLPMALSSDKSFAAAAIAHAEAALRKSSLAPGDPSAAEALAGCREMLRGYDGRAEAHLALGRIGRALGAADEAIREFDRALALDPGLYQALLEKGLTLEDSGREAEAEAAYRAAVRMRPGCRTAYAYLGYLHFFQGDYRRARDMYLEVARLCPGHLQNLNNLGAAHLRLGDETRAEAAFMRSNAVRRNADACSNLAYLYYYRGRFADAVIMNEAAAGFDSGYFMIWGNLADAYDFTPGNEGKAAEARRRATELAEKELAAKPDDHRARARLSEYLAKSGEAARARAEIETALRARPGDATIVLTSILTYELTGDRERALEGLREYARLGGSMTEVARDPFLAALRQDPGYAAAVRARGAG